jgi:hypothetical protein
MHVACVATEPLDRAGARGSAGRGARPHGKRDIYHFLRLTPDDRVPIGGGGATTTSPGTG